MSSNPKTKFQQSVQPTNGWNPITVNKYDNRVANFRCQGCGTLQGIGTRDMQAEFEHKCPVCGLGMVFNRKQHKLPQAQVDALARMMSPNPYK